MSDKHALICFNGDRRGRDIRRPKDIDDEGIEINSQWMEKGIERFHKFLYNFWPTSIPSFQKLSIFQIHVYIDSYHSSNCFPAGTHNTFIKYIKLREKAKERNTEKRKETKKKKIPHNQQSLISSVLTEYTHYL